jgi:hypothetical protein
VLLPFRSPVSVVEVHVDPTRQFMFRKPFWKWYCRPYEGNVAAVALPTMGLHWVDERHQPPQTATNNTKLRHRHAGYIQQTCSTVFTSASRWVGRSHPPVDYINLILPDFTSAIGVGRSADSHSASGSSRMHRVGGKSDQTNSTAGFK